MKYEAVIDLIERELEQLFKQQRDRAGKLARRLVPDLTPEDILNPDDYPKLIADPEFMFEHGAASGIMSAKIALRAVLKEIDRVEGEASKK
ncbi:MAG: hypothetical protein RL417_2420 [Pseudomonadota bacterium]|jgi:hypothetical protein